MTVKSDFERSKRKILNEMFLKFSIPINRAVYSIFKNKNTRELINEYKCGSHEKNVVKLICFQREKMFRNFRINRRIRDRRKKKGKITKR